MVSARSSSEHSYDDPEWPAEPEVGGTLLAVGVDVLEITFGAEGGAAGGPSVGFADDWPVNGVSTSMRQS